MNESLVFAGYDTLNDLGLTMLQAPSLDPPEPKTNLVDIPGGDGTVDLSEFSGDVRYNDREMEFQFLLNGRTPDAIHREVTDILRKFHGVRSEFELSFDPGFTYTGRASVTESPNLYHGGTLTLKITADPYKHGGTETWKVNAAGGIAVIIPCGRRRWSPAFQVERETLVSFEGKSWTLPPGTSRITELYLNPGDNVLVLNTDPDYGSKVLNDYAGMTWADVASQYHRLYEVAAGDSPRQVPLTLADLTGSWSDYAGNRIVELVHDSEQDPSYTAYIQVEIYEL